jgi:hypothetical protein
MIQNNCRGMPMDEISLNALDLLHGLLTIDPIDRLSLPHVLQHRFCRAHCRTQQ